MDLSEEMKKMIDVVKQYDFALKRNRYKSYIAPDIPDKIIKKLLKNFDSHMPINSIVAYYDDTAFETTTRGTVFTSDGVYFKDIICKPVYFQYSDIIDCEITDKGLRLHLQNCVDSYYENIAALDVPTKKIVIEQLKKIDFEYGQTTFKSSGKIKKLIYLKICWLNVMVLFIAHLWLAVVLVPAWHKSLPQIMRSLFRFKLE